MYILWKCQTKIKVREKKYKVNYLVSETSYTFKVIARNILRNSLSKSMKSKADQSMYVLKCLSHQKPCNIKKKNVTKLISVRKKRYAFSKYLMPSILEYIIHISYIFSFSL